jgi:hypothetical protein
MVRTRCIGSLHDVNHTDKRNKGKQEHIPCLFIARVRAGIAFFLHADVPFARSASPRLTPASTDQVRSARSVFPRSPKSGTTRAETGVGRRGRLRDGRFLRI